MSLRIAVIGAVGSSEVAVRSLVRCGHPPSVILTLPLEDSKRHSDFVDLEPLAREVGVPVLRVGDVNEPGVVAELARYDLDIVFVVGWSRICGPEVRALGRIGALGYHPTLLPKMRGRAALAWTILLDLQETGGTLFWLDEGVDSGDVAAQARFSLAPRPTLADLLDRQLDALGEMVGELFGKLAAGERPAVPQDHSQATYLAVRRPSHGEIDWNQKAVQIERLIRAVSRPYPGAFTYHKGRKLVIWSAEVVSRPEWFAQPGQIFVRESTVPLVRCGHDTDLALTEYEIMPDSSEATTNQVIVGQPVLGRTR